MKVLKWIALLAFSLVFVTWMFIYVVAFGINEMKIYKENDFFSYHMLTDKDIKNSPRISTHYSFESQPGDGYPPSNAIIFQGAESIETIRRYLIELGYQREKRRMGESEVWIKPEKVRSDIFYLSLNKNTKEAELTKVLIN